MSYRITAFSKKVWPHVQMALSAMVTVMVVLSLGRGLSPAEIAAAIGAGLVSTGIIKHGLVERFRSGPPAWSMFRMEKVDTAANSAEFFIHHEDVRRAVDGWEPRALAPEHDEFLWKMLSSRGKFLFRGSPVGVRLQTSDGREAVVRDGRHTGALPGTALRSGRDTYTPAMKRFKPVVGR